MAWIKVQYKALIFKLLLFINVREDYLTSNFSGRFGFGTGEVLPDHFRINQNTPNFISGCIIAIDFNILLKESCNNIMSYLGKREIAVSNIVIER